MHPLLNTAVQAVRAASKNILYFFDRLDSVPVTEKAYNDYVSEVDRAAEQEIIAIIRKTYPDHAIIGEEFGASGETGFSDYEWIIDPLDGTVNYLHGHPHFCIALAVKNRGKIICSLIYDPVRQELFTAEYGAGAFCNNHRLRVSTRSSFHGALLGVAFAHDQENALSRFFNTQCAIELSTAGLRRSGSASLDLAYVAQGRLDGFWGFGLKLWDVAPGSLLVKEAGGVGSDFTGSDDYLTHGNVIAAGTKVFKELLGKIQSKLQTSPI
jgi:myo-inositol-1(or 4)-monophosphatase